MKSVQDFFHHGPDIGFKTHALKGTASIDVSGLKIQGPQGSSFIPSATIREVELFRLHGMSRVIRVDHEGGRVYLAAVKFMIGQFASVNFFKTGKLFKELQALAASHG